MKFRILICIGMVVVGFYLSSIVLSFNSEIQENNLMIEEVLDDGIL